MGICYYLFSRTHRVAFELGKGFGDYGPGGLHGLLPEMHRAERLPARDVFDRAVRTTWCVGAEMSKSEYDDACHRDQAWWDPARWIWDEAGDCYVSLGQWTDGNGMVRQENADGRPGPAATHESALREAKARREYAQRVADRLWTFCEKYGPAGLEIDNDCNDLPWHEWGERVTGPWFCVASRYDEDANMAPRRLDA